MNRHLSAPCISSASPSASNSSHRNPPVSYMYKFLHVFHQLLSHNLLPVADINILLLFFAVLSLFAVPHLAIFSGPEIANHEELPPLPSMTLTVPEQVPDKRSRAANSIRR